MQNINKRLIGLLVGILVALLSACAPPAPGVPVTSKDQTQTSTPQDVLVHTSWNLTSYGPPNAQKEVTQGSEITLQFNENGSAEGSSDCNTFGAYYRQSTDNQISITNLISTERACTDSARMEQEHQYYQALKAANRFEVAGDILKIWYEKGQNVLTFSKAGTATAPAPTTISPTLVVPTTVPATTVPTTVNPTTSSGNANSAQRIEFAAGATSTTVTGQLAASESDQYVLHALAGQTMSIDLTFTEGKAILVVWGADGNVLLSDHAEASHFQQVLLTTQDYYIQVHGRPEGNTSYNMTVSIPPVPPAASGAKRIEFAPGATSATVTGQLGSGGSDQYVVQGSAGQTMNVDLTFTQGNAILVVWGADGNVLLTDHAEVSHFQGVLPSTQDYFIMVKGQPGGATTYNMTVTIPPMATP